MAFFSKQFVKLTGKWIPRPKTVSTYDAKRLAKDIEKESTEDLELEQIFE